jgi:protein phosphatase
VHGAVDAAGFWEQFHTDWICLDAELMPWSAKAQELLRQQYAAVGSAPFHLLATEGQVHVQRDHVWHMEKLAEICKPGDGLLLATPYKIVDVTDTSSVEEATRWWEELTGRGGEGMVVKPMDFIVRGSRGLTQPAVKCRGPEYLRIIYGPEYLLPENLERLRSRSVAAKRSLALREFALGIEALERFVRQEPLRRVHECVFGVLALESEPVDPRL